jgi:hypothetical protein
MRDVVSCTLVRVGASGRGTEMDLRPFEDARPLPSADTDLGPNSMLKGSESRQFDRQVTSYVERLCCS